MADKKNVKQGIWKPDPLGRPDVEKVTKTLELPVWTGGTKGDFRKFWEELWSKLDVFAADKNTQIEGLDNKKLSLSGGNMTGDIGFVINGGNRGAITCNDEQLYFYKPTGAGLKLKQNEAELTKRLNIYRDSYISAGGTGYANLHFGNEYNVGEYTGYVGIDRSQDAIQMVYKDGSNKIQIKKDVTAIFKPIAMPHGGRVAAAQNGDSYLYYMKPNGDFGGYTGVDANYFNCGKYGGAVAKFSNNNVSFNKDVNITRDTRSVNIQEATLNNRGAYSLRDNNTTSGVTYYPLLSHYVGQTSSNHDVQYSIGYTRGVNHDDWGNIRLTTFVDENPSTRKDYTFGLDGHFTLPGCVLSHGNNLSPWGGENASFQSTFEGRAFDGALTKLVDGVFIPNNTAEYSRYGLGAYDGNMVLYTTGWQNVRSTALWKFNPFNGSFTSGGNIVAASDKKLKKNLKVIPDALKKIKAVNGYTYERIDTGEKQTGVVAQEIQKILPQAVTETIDTEGEKTLGVAYGNLVGLLIEGIKEQQNKIDSLEERIMKLEKNGVI